jgi:hypothetical protein
MDWEDNAKHWQSRVLWVNPMDWEDVLSEAKNGNPDFWALG